MCKGVKPLLAHIEKVLSEFISDEKRANSSTADKVEQACALMLDIGKSIIHDDLIKYLAPHF